MIEHPIHLELLRIPAGEFWMGSDPEKDKAARDNEQPQHRVSLAEFYLGRYPITNAQYAAFKKIEIPLGKENHPVVNVSWKDALAFSGWLSEQTGKNFRLPTEAEWEKAARGADGRIYPWGDEWDARRANSGESGIKGASSVGKYSPAGDSPYGVVDMSGNVWEWCQSKYAPYPYQPDDGREELAGEAARALRGGSWRYYHGYCRAATRFWIVPAYSNSFVGFRVALSPSSS